MKEVSLDLVDLNQPKTGYRDFISCWVYQQAGLTFLVDPGPRSTADHLLATLSELEIRQLDFILLTHIHLDHAAATADVLKVFPRAKVYCHEIGVKHLIEPTRLFEGSRQVLGEVAEMYGKPDPVPGDRMAGLDELETRGIKVIPTPGHAPHHVSFLVDDLLFVGEAVGTRAELDSGKPYLRPATPPRFKLDVALESLDRLLALDPEPKFIAFAHYGLASDTFTWCRRAKKQLAVWVETIRQLCEPSEDQLAERLFSRLMEIDPLYGRGRFDELDDDLQVRERGFLDNTLDGMLGYLKTLD